MYVPPFISQILDFIYRTVLVFVYSSKRTIAPILIRKYLIASRKLVFTNQMALFGDDFIRKYTTVQKCIQ